MKVENPQIFRQYDIRGRADRDLSSALTSSLGRALASELRSESEPATIVVARDCRASSDRLHEALVDGMLQHGAKVIDIGIGPTPLLYFAAHHIPCSGAVVITGSHNPAEDNGFKMLRGTHSLFGDDIQKLRMRIENDDFAEETPGTKEKREIGADYLKNAETFLRLGERRTRIVVDGGNGTGGPLATELYQRLGFEVVPLFCDMDGRFPNHHPDPTQPENLRSLQEAVQSHRAELGLAFDGDADRLGAVDSQGRILYGDQLLLLLGRALLEEVPDAKILGEVKCSQTLFDDLGARGAKTMMSQVGHSLIKAKMKSWQAHLAGEMSGHIFFAHRYLGFDDGIFAGARLLEMLSRDDRSLADHFDTLPECVNTPELRLPCPDESKFAVVEAVKQILASAPELVEIVDIDGVRARFHSGWGLVRASNTQASLVMRCEAESEEALATIVQTMESAVAQARHEAEKA